MMSSKKNHNGRRFNLSVPVQLNQVAWRPMLHEGGGEGVRQSNYSDRCRTTFNDQNLISYF